MTVKPYAHKWLQNSIIGRIEGSTLANETVVIGAHMDTINARGGSEAAAPGAGTF